MKKLIIFPFDFINKTDYIINKFLFSENNNFSSVLYLTSKQTKIEDFKFHLWKIKQKPLILPQCFTLKSFAAKIVEENSSYKIINSIEEFFIIYQLLENYNEIYKLNEINPISFTEKLIGFIKDIKISHSQIDHQFYKKEISQYPWKYPQNKDMVMFALDILEKYQDYLSKNFLADENDLYKISSENIITSEYQTLLIDGLYEILPNQKKFFQTIINLIDNIIFVYYYDENISIDSKEMILKKNLDIIKSFTQWDIETLAESKKETKIFTLMCPSPEEEVKNIAENIYNLLSEGKNPEDILILFPSMPSYRPLVQRIFQRENLLFKLTPGYSLDQDISIISIFSLFDYIESSDWEIIMNIFFNPFFNFDKKEAEKFSEESRKFFENVGFFPDKKWLTKWKNYRKLQTAVKGFFKNSFTLKGWIEELKYSLKQVNWKPFDNEVGEDFFKILKYMEKDIIATRKEFIFILRNLFNMFEIEKSKGSGIRVMGVLDSSAIEAKYIFFGGATSEDLPMCQKTDEFFIPDTLREKLGFNYFNLMVARERLDLYRLKKENRQIIFSYPVKVNGEKKTKSIMLYNYPEQISVLKNIYFIKGKNIFDISFDKEKFKKKFFKDGHFQFNVTDMDKIARCPYKFYIENVEEITIYKEPSVEEIPMIWGNIIHKSLEDITKPYTGKIIDNVIIKEWKESFEEMCMFYITHPEKINSQVFQISPIVQKFLNLRISSVVNTFEKIINSHTGHTIYAVEEKVTLLKENILFKAKFDRIEQTTEFVEIIDIKTGNIPNVKKRLQQPEDFTSIFKIGNLQIPLYYMISLENFKKDINIFVWALNFDETKSKEKLYNFDKDFITLFEKYLSKFSESLYNETFSFYPLDEESCYNCQFKEFCILGNNK
jgi:CRISPR/Cas system-associated exonuclease Cas4 (RecB family)